MLRTIDLFAGCGGLSLGFKNSGFKIVAAYDNWLPAIEVYKMNFKSHEIFNVDLGNGFDTSCIDKFKPEIIIGGPPCQDFSSAGKRNENLGRADLTISFANIVRKMKPNIFVMENVDRIRRSKTLKNTIKIFKQSNYGLSFRVLNASLCGVPQIRKRFFLIGELNGNDGFLDQYLDSFLDTKAMTIRDYLGGDLDVEYYYRHPWSYKRRAIFSIDEPSPTIRGVNRPIPKGYKGHPKDSASVDINLRPLSTKERSRIQTFPADFIWVGSKTDLEQMIGNAVPVKLAEYVANCIKMYLQDKKCIY